MNRTLKVVESITGLTFDEINSLDFESERELVKRKTNKILHFSKQTDSRIFGRGNPLLAKKRITTIEDLDDKLEDIVKNADSRKR